MPLDTVEFVRHGRQAEAAAGTGQRMRLAGQVSIIRGALQRRPATTRLIIEFGDNRREILPADLQQQVIE